MLSLWPIYIITYQIFYNKLGPEPVDRIINHFGEWTLIFVLLTLSMTPLKKITNSVEWIKFRRMLGLFAFFYASIHMLSYVGLDYSCLLYTSPSPRDRQKSRMPSSA